MDWIEESHCAHVGNELSIQVLSGPFFASMSFVVREIGPANPGFLLLPDLSSDSHDKMQSFASVPSLPYALSDYNIDKVKSECLKYINTISKCPLHVLEILDGNTSKIVWRSLEAVWQFLRSNLAARQAGTDFPHSPRIKKLISKIEPSLTQRYQAILDTICHGTRYQSQRGICDHSRWRSPKPITAFPFSAPYLCTCPYPAD